MTRLISPWLRLPWRHWKMAECSLSTGTISAPQRADSLMTSSPPQTRVSLLARAMRFFSWMAAKVGSRPIMPTTAVSTVSASGRVAASNRPVRPEATRVLVSAMRVFKSAAADSSQHTASFGWNLRTWSSSCATLRLAATAATDIPQAAITSRDCRPMEPVEPSKDMVLILSST